MDGPNSIKKLHELSIQRQIESGQTLKENDSFCIDNLDDQETFQDKIIGDQGRAIPMTKRIIKQWDEKIFEIQKWRQEEEEDFQRQLQEIEQQQSELQKDQDSRQKEQEDNSNTEIKQVRKKYQKLDKEMQDGWNQLNTDYTRYIETKGVKGDELATQGNKITDDLDLAERRLQQLNMKNQVNNWVFESENLFKKLTSGATDNGKLQQSNSEDEDELDSLDREVDIDELKKARDQLKSSLSGQEENSKRMGNLKDHFKDIDDDFDELDKLMNECGLDFGDDDEDED